MTDGVETLKKVLEKVKESRYKVSSKIAGMPAKKYEALDKALRTLLGMYLIADQFYIFMPEEKAMEKFREKAYSLKRYLDEFLAPEGW